MNQPHLFAFLADRLASARVDIRSDYELISTKGPDMGTFMYEGQETPFKIITQPEQLRGLNLCGWAFVSSSRWLPPSKRNELELIASTRVRQCAASDAVNTDHRK